MDERISVIPFHYRVGETTFASVQRRLIVRNPVLFGDSDDVVGRVPTLDSICSEVSGVLLRSMPIERPLPKLHWSSEWIRYVPRQYERYFIDLSTTYESYLASFSTKSRSTLRRKVRRFERESGGEISFGCYRTPEEVENFYSLAREVSQETYQERLLDAGLPRSDEFRRTMVAAATAGNVRGYLIFLQSRAIAYLYCPIRNRVVHYSYLGYRAEYEQLSPGTVLLWLAIEDLFKERVHRALDFTEGGDATKHSQKRLFSSGRVFCADVFFLRRNLRNLFLVLSHASTERFVEWVGRGMESAGIKRTYKRWIRRLSSRRGELSASVEDPGKRANVVRVDAVAEEPSRGEAWSGRSKKVEEASPAGRDQ